MINFYKKAFLAFLLLAIVTFIFSYIGLKSFYLDNQLLPINDNNLYWQSQIKDDSDHGGNSLTTLNDDVYSLNVDFNVKPQTLYPYASISLAFTDPQGEPRLVDFSRYQSITFTIKCEPHNVLLFAVYTVDDTATQLDDMLSYRTPTTFISCDNHWQQGTIDLTRLETPQWWFDKFGLELSKQDYQLNKVPRFTFGTTHQSPMNIDANVQITELTLHGNDWRYLLVLISLLLVLWSLYLVWFFKQQSKAIMADLKEKLYKDRPLVAYQKLSLEPQKDKEKTAMLRFIATEYANPDLNLDLIIHKLGINRSKINEILKEELGFTFTAYLNKLRLTEAARLLASKQEANVAEIAYSVGYKNVTYFNKLFKKEFNCSPRAFTKMQRP